MRQGQSAWRFAGPVLAFLMLAGIAIWLAERNRGWSVSPDFAGEDARLEMSGAACGPDACLAVNDETNWAQTFSLEGRTLVPGRTIRLSEDDTEIDAEAVAHDAGAFHVTGSHGLSRKKAKFRPSQFQVVRISGSRIERSTRLRAVIADALPKFAEQPLDENGVTIEGLAARDGQLWFGFRGPSVDGDAFVLEVGTEPLFGSEPLDPVLHKIPLGDRIGIRDMARWADGFLLLTGPVNDSPPVQQIVSWQPGDAPQTLYTLPRRPEAKAEVLLVLSDTRVLILHDGLENGGPMEIILPR